MWSATDKNMSFDQVKKDSSNAKKDLKLVGFIKDYSDTKSQT